METRFGHDFSRVRVHADDGAANSTRAVDARAYTVGQHLVFGGGQYAPESPPASACWRTSLRTSSSRRAPRRRPAADVGQVDDPAEREADAAADRRPSTAPWRPSFGGAGLIQRQTPSATGSTQETTTPELRPSGDTERTSPSGGVAIRNGTLQWTLRYVGNAGRIIPGQALTITQGTDVEMEAVFTPTAGASGCPTVTFLQTVRPTTGGLLDTGHLLFTRSATGASADVLERETEPYYGAGPAQGRAGLESEQGAALAGSTSGRSGTATFKDGPVRARDAIPPGQLLVRAFELAVICVESGETFGSVSWGYTKTRDGVITLTGGQPTDARAAGASAELEDVRRSFYSGFFQHSLSGFARGSATLTAQHRAALRSVAETGLVHRIVLVGANDNSGGREQRADVSLRRAEAARDALVRLGVSASLIEVQGHGVAARVRNPAGVAVPENRRVDIHVERGTTPTNVNQEGSALEALRLRRQDPRRTFRELLDLINTLQITPGPIPERSANQLIHLTDALRRWRQLDPSVPAVDELYGSTIRALLARRQSTIPRAEFPRLERPLEPPSFLDRIGADARRIEP